VAHFDLQISSLTSEYIRSRVDAKEAGVQVDPTATAPEFAFMTDAATEPSSYTLGSWETDNTGPDPVYYARIQVGTGGDIVLTDDDYWVWLKVVSAPETPIRRIGRLKVT
jgi:hypothetical protein